MEKIAITLATACILISTAAFLSVSVGVSCIGYCYGQDTFGIHKQ